MSEKIKLVSITGALYAVFISFMTWSLTGVWVDPVHEKELIAKQVELNSQLCAHSQWRNESYRIIDGLLHCKASNSSYQRLVAPTPIDYNGKKDSVMVAIIKELE